jgi:GntR family transcriptional regulator
LTQLSGEPAYRQVANDLRRQIEQGSLPVDSPLPSYAQLAATFDVSSTVIKAAINELRADGLVIGQPGKGVFVRAARAATPSAGGSDEYRSLMGQVQALRDEVHAVNARLAAVEDAVADHKD